MCPRLGEGLSGQGAWSQGSTLLPTVQSSGQPVNAREAWPFCPCSGEVFLGLGVAAQSGRPEREPGLVPTIIPPLQGGQGFGRHRSPVGGKVALTATQSGATLKRTAVCIDI